jgi:RNA polymerase-binding transcription factor DksA
MTRTAATIPKREEQPRLTPEQQRALRALITERLRTHTGRADRMAAALDDLSSSAPQEERHLARDTLQELIDQVLRHEDALMRLDSGRYGACSVCGRDLPFECLETLPEVGECVGCVRIG